MEAYSPERFSSIEGDLESCRAQLSSATSENLELRQKFAECDSEKCRLGKELEEANAVRKEGVRQCGLWGGTKAGCGVAENSAGGVKARREIFRHQDNYFAVYQNGIGLSLRFRLRMARHCCAIMPNNYKSIMLNINDIYLAFPLLSDE